MNGSSPLPWKVGERISVHDALIRLVARDTGLSVTTVKAVVDAWTARHDGLTNATPSARDWFDTTSRQERREGTT